MHLRKSQPAVGQSGLMDVFSAKTAGVFSLKTSGECHSLEAGLLEYVLICQMSVLFSKMSVYCMCACEREARGRLSNLPPPESCDSSELLDVAE